jgi:hypothetical protein
VSLEACSSDAPTEPHHAIPSFEVSGAFALSIGPVTQLADGRVSYEVIVANRALSAITVTWGDCRAFLQLFSDASRSGNPAFDEGGDPLLGCAAYSRTDTVAVGASLSLPRIVPASMLAGVSAGHYFTAVRVAPNGHESTYPSAELDFRR